MVSPNMPRLPWRHSESGGYVAFPNGEDARDQLAWIRYSVVRPEAFCWVWGVAWEGRFEAHFAEASKQAAADRATERWWLLLEETEGWVPTPEPPPPPPDPMIARRDEVRRRLERILPTLDDRQFRYIFERYKMASIVGPTIEGDNELDRWAWMLCGQEFIRRDRGS